MDLITIGAIIATASLPLLWSQISKDLNLNLTNESEKNNTTENVKTP